MFIMKRNNIFSQVQLFLIVAVFGVLSQAFKLPIDLRKLSQETQMQLQLERVEQSQDAPKKVLRFPEQTYDSDEADYTAPISFRSNGNDSDQKESNSGTNKGLKRFYKYSHESQPKSAQSILFPIDNTESLNDKKIGLPDEESGDGIHRSQEKPIEKPGMFIVFKESQDFPNNETSFKHSLEALAQMVRQLLFRAPVNDATQHPANVVQSQDIIDAPSSEMDVSEQSLYAGPKLRTQSESDNCPEGTKKTRNGSCQKPSRRLITIT